jgi:actin-related protein
VLSGGSTLLKGFGDRLLSELKKVRLDALASMAGSKRLTANRRLPTAPSCASRRHLSGSALPRSSCAPAAR